MTTDDRHKITQSITIKGIILNIVLIVMKLTAGIFGKSSALIADAIHSASDLITDVVVLFGSYMGAKPRDRNHNFGHGKIETLSTAIMALILAGAALFIMFDASVLWLSYLKGAVLQKPTPIALIIAGVSIVSKEIIYHFTLRAGKRINSKILIANAWHHRSDALTSIGVFAGIAGAMLLGEKWAVLDPIAAIIVSFVIIRLAFILMRESIKELIETSLPENQKQEIITLAQSVDGVINPHNLKTRSIGNHVAIDMHIYVDDNLNIIEAHDISREVEKKLRMRFGSESFISVHIEPKSIKT